MKLVINPAWLQAVKMDAIVVHWSAGSHVVSELDKEHYHIIVSGKGEIVKGDHDISDNVNVQDNDYAAHCRGFNTRVIGISMACMAGAIESPFNPGPFPMTKVQWDLCMQACAQLATFYRIPIIGTKILTHAEVQPTLGIKQNGKWDVTRLAFDPTVKGAKQVGDLMRRQITAFAEYP
jgi:hypothetical protein